MQRSRALGEVAPPTWDGRDAPAVSQDGQWEMACQDCGTMYQTRPQPTQKFCPDKDCQSSHQEIRLASGRMVAYPNTPSAVEVLGRQRKAAARDEPKEARMTQKAGSPPGGLAPQITPGQVPPSLATAETIDRVRQKNAQVQEIRLDQQLENLMAGGPQGRDSQLITWVQDKLLEQVKVNYALERQIDDLRALVVWLAGELGKHMSAAPMAGHFRYRPDLFPSPLRQSSRPG